MRMLTEDVGVAGQISVADVSRIKYAGFKSIICHRPDGESFGQTPFGDIEAAAKAEGLEIRYQPVSSRQMTTDDVEKFSKLLDELPRPILAYCASGARSSILFNMTQQHHSRTSAFWR